MPRAVYNWVGTRSLSWVKGTLKKIAAALSMDASFDMLYFNARAMAANMVARHIIYGYATGNWAQDHNPDWCGSPTRDPSSSDWLWKPFSLKTRVKERFSLQKRRRFNKRQSFHPFEWKADLRDSKEQGQMECFLPKSHSQGGTSIHNAQVQQRAMKHMMPGQKSFPMLSEEGFWALQHAGGR